MTSNNSTQPIYRSPLRLKLGKAFYTSKRYLKWLFDSRQFARRKDARLPYTCFAHETPLLRRLKDVDMILQHNKVINLKIAVPKVSGIVLYPGETFSYWRLIGKPTRRKGYVKGMILQNGGFTAGTGGGLCQLSNLIYWMTVHTPLTVIERHRHGYDVFPDSNRTQPFGSGATCFYNYGDLMIRNDTQSAFQLTVEVTDTHLKGMWLSDTLPEYGYVVYEKEHMIRSETGGGYSRHNLLYRHKLRLDGTVADDEFVVENHARMMYSPLLSQENGG